MAIYEDDFLKITTRQPESDQERGSVLLSFTGIGHAMGGLNVQKPEFFGAGRAFDNIIFVTDKTRSWANLLDFNKIKATLEPLIGSRQVYSIGNSMGGFNAIVASHFIPTHVCVAFVPQFSVHPDLVPWEERWTEYTSNIRQFSINNAGDYMNDTTQYFLFTGGKGPDLEHAKLFPVKDNIHHYSFRNITHNVAQSLKEMDVLGQVVQDCFSLSNDLPADLEYDLLSPSDA